MQPLPAISTPAYFFGLAGPLSLGIALGIQLFLGALLLVPSAPRPLEELSGSGRLFVFPEWDIPLFLGSIPVSLALALLLSLAYGRKLQAAGVVPAARLIRQSLGRITVAVSATALFLLTFASLQSRVLYESLTYNPARLGNASGHAAILLALLAVTAGAGLVTRVPAGDRASEPAQPVHLPDDRSETGPRRSPWDLLAPAAVVLLIYVPAWRQVAGSAFLADTLLHWDYFAMGPALSFSHGLALGSEVHSAYGVGWPLVFAALHEWIPLTYGQMIHAGSVYACLYLIGIYLLLRLTVRRPVLAAVGTGLAMLPFFVGLHGLVIWLIPNVSVLRWPLDVWCFICLLMYLRSSGRIWALATGALTGLAIVFVIDTGAQLAAAVTVYWLLALMLDPSRRRRQDAALAATAAAGVLLTGLAISGRGDVLDTDFLLGWLEAPLVFGRGFGMNPMITSAHPLTIAGFVVLIALYLTLVAFALVKVLYGRAGPFELFTGAVGSYGLLVLVKFAGQSADLILPRLLIPAGLLVTILLDRLATRTARYVRSRRSGASARTLLRTPYAMLAAALIVLLALPGSPLREGIKAYPNLGSVHVWDSERFAETGVCLMEDPKDLCGLPPRLAGTADTFHRIVEDLRNIRRSGHDFAVVDETGSLFYVATGTPPFGRYSRMFTSTPTKDLIQEVRRSFEAKRPDFILNRLPVGPDHPAFGRWSRFGLGPVPGAAHLDLWQMIDEVIDDHYELVRETGPFQLWVRRGLGSG